jgi:hypothetical protein
MSNRRNLAGLLNSSGLVPLPTKVAGVLPDANAPSGSVIQVVHTIKQDKFDTSSQSWVDVTGLSASITPISASSRILVAVALCGMSNNDHSYFKVVRGSTDVGVGIADSGSSPAASGGSFYRIGTSGQHQCSTTFVDSPNTTSNLTYKVQVYTWSAFLRLGWGNNDTSANSARTPQVITLMEIAA